MFTAASDDISRWSTLVHFVSRTGRSLLTWQRRRRTINTLMALDDNVLKHIGLHRSEVHSATYHLRDRSGFES
jgi:uncharacterized protein YjiS (DUF1127 family)